MRVWFFSSVVSTIFMFVLSFVCHGFVLPDFEKLNIPLSTHLLKALISYLILSLLMVFVFNRYKSRIPNKYFAILVGSLFGVLYYSIILFFSDSFTQSFIFHSYQNVHIFFDYAWQILEQGLGGLVAARAMLFFGLLEEVYLVRIVVSPIFP